MSELEAPVVSARERTRGLRPADRFRKRAVGSPWKAGFEEVNEVREGPNERQHAAGRLFLVLC